jgi:hypothetical protein
VSKNNEKWVELPNCSDPGADKKFPLNEGLENASWATCKEKGKNYIKEISDEEANEKKPSKAKPEA